MFKKSFSLIEILLAIGIFCLIASFFIFLIISSYQINEQARDLTIATHLAEEGIEALRLIRDINFQELGSNPYSYCLAMENNRWVLKKIPGKDCLEEVKLNNKIFYRQIYISSISSTKRKVVSLVSWKTKSGLKREVRLFSRITNWIR
jgi:type II secretory pathway pseudopilin PulG